MTNYQISGQTKKVIEETVGVPFEEIVYLDEEDIDRICIERHDLPRHAQKDKTWILRENGDKNV